MLASCEKLAGFVYNSSWLLECENMKLIQDVQVYYIVTEY